MLSVKSYVTATVNGKNAHFVCPPDMSIDEALEANVQHRTFLLGRKQMAAEAAQTQTAAESVKEEPKSE